MLEITQKEQAFLQRSIYNDPELRDLLQRVKEVTDTEGWLIKKEVFWKKRLFKRSERVEVFSLFRHHSDLLWDTIDFPTEYEGEDDYEIVTNRRTLISYLLGVIHGSTR